MKFTDINLDEELIAASRSIMEKREPIIINPEMHNMDTVQRLQMGDEGYSDEEGKDSKDRQKDNKDKKHEFYEDEFCAKCGSSSKECMCPPPKPGPKPIYAPKEK